MVDATLHSLRSSMDLAIAAPIPDRFLAELHHTDGGWEDDMLRTYPEFLRKGGAVPLKCVACTLLKTTDSKCSQCISRYQFETFLKIKCIQRVSRELHPPFPRTNILGKPSIVERLKLNSGISKYCPNTKVM